MVPKVEEVNYNFKNFGELGVKFRESDLGMQEKWKGLEDE